MSEFTHLNENGEAQMVDVSAKDITTRSATACARINMQPSTLRMIIEGNHKKGDVLAVARIAGIQAAKKTWELIPLCHQIALSSVKVDLMPNEKSRCVDIQATAKCSGQTGVEMEALTAASHAALTIYDMCKAVDRGMIIDNIALQEKLGGKSGHWQRDNEA